MHVCMRARVCECVCVWVGAGVSVVHNGLRSLAGTSARATAPASTHPRLVSTAESSSAAVRAWRVAFDQGPFHDRDHVRLTAAWMEMRM